MIPAMTVAEARRIVIRRLEASGVESAAPEALALLEAATGLDRTALLLQPDRPLDEGERRRLLATLRRRVTREPLQHILGLAPFYGLELEVDPAVLIPRPETERLVELVLEHLKRIDAPRLLDVGTGSGAVALAVKAERPDAVVMASDVAAEAVAVARRNAARLDLDVRVVRSDLLADGVVATFAARCHALVANLPYLPLADSATLQAEASRDPALALYGGEDGLELARRLLRQATRVLQAGALLALELDPRNVRTALRETVGWRTATVESDLAGRERFLLAVR